MKFDIWKKVIKLDIKGIIDEDVAASIRNPHGIRQEQCILFVQERLHNDIS